MCVCVCVCVCVQPTNRYRELTTLAAILRESPAFTLSAIVTPYKQCRLLPLLRTC